LTVTLTRRGALIGTTVFAVLLMGWGAAHAGVVQPPGAGTGPGGHAPAVIPVRVAVLDPSTGAVIWSSVALPRRIVAPRRIVLNPATGSVTSTGLPSAR
jgi:hypothetical protein